MLLEIEKTVAEGAAAAGLAALVTHAPRFRNRKVGLVLSGGNIDPLTLAFIMERGLARSGRLVRLNVELRDLPGSLAQVTSALASLGANIEEVHHQRTFTQLPLQTAEVEFVVQTRNHEHVRGIVRELERAGYKPRLHSDTSSHVTRSARRTDACGAAGKCSPAAARSQRRCSGRCAARRRASARRRSASRSGRCGPGGARSRAGRPGRGERRLWRRRGGRCNRLRQGDHVARHSPHDRRTVRQHAIHVPVRAEIRHGRALGRHIRRTCEPRAEYGEGAEDRGCKSQKSFIGVCRCDRCTTVAVRARLPAGRTGATAAEKDGPRPLRGCCATALTSSKQRNTPGQSSGPTNGKTTALRMLTAPLRTQCILMANEVRPARSDELE